jgi:hypothetical protein
LERLVLRQLVGEHLRELSYALMTSEGSAVDENDDVLGDIPSKVLVEDVIERDVHPVVRKVQVVIKYFLRRAAAQILHDRLLLGRCLRTFCASWGSRARRTYGGSVPVAIALVGWQRGTESG